MARRGPLSAAKSHQEAHRREMRPVEQQRCATRAEARAQTREAAKSEDNGPGGQ